MPLPGPRTRIGLPLETSHEDESISTGAGRAAASR